MGGGGGLGEGERRGESEGGVMEGGWRGPSVSNNPHNA